MTISVDLVAACRVVRNGLKRPLSRSNGWSHFVGSAGSAERH
jgi:hypothetical protein